MNSYFYLADDMQLLVGGKTMMIGVYTDKVLLVNAPAEAQKSGEVALPALAMMVTLTGLSPEERVTQPVLILPDGSPSAIKVPPMKFNGGTHGTANLLVKFVPILLPQAGTYTFSVPIDGTTIDCKFEVRFQELSSQGFKR